MCSNVNTTKPQASSHHRQLLNKKARQEWSKCRDIPIKISKPQAVGMAGGKVYVGGGDTTHKQVFRYDSSTNECNHVPPHWWGISPQGTRKFFLPMPTGRSHTTTQRYVNYSTLTVLNAIHKLQTMLWLAPGVIVVWNSLITVGGLKSILQEEFTGKVKTLLYLEVGEFSLIKSWCPGGIQQCNWSVVHRWTPTSCWNVTLWSPSQTHGTNWEELVLIAAYFSYHSRSGRHFT